MNQTKHNQQSRCVRSAAHTLPCAGFQPQRTILSAGRIGPVGSPMYRHTESVAHDATALTNFATGGADVAPRKNGRPIDSFAALSAHESFGVPRGSERLFELPDSYRPGCDSIFGQIERQVMPGVPTNNPVDRPRKATLSRGDTSGDAAAYRRNAEPYGVGAGFFSREPDLITGFNLSAWRNVKTQRIPSKPQVAWDTVNQPASSNLAALTNFPVTEGRRANTISPFSASRSVAGATKPRAADKLPPPVCGKSALCRSDLSRETSFPPVNIAENSLLCEVTVLLTGRALEAVRN